MKSNIGHLEGASGLAGVVKSVLSLERGLIPPNANFEVLNPHIDAEFFHLVFPITCIPWPRSSEVRRASVNSFGFGGSNAHVILEASDTYLQRLGTRLSQSLSTVKLWAQPPLRQVNGVSDSTNHDTCNEFPLASKQGHEECQPGLEGVIMRPRLLILSASDAEGVLRQATSLSRAFSGLSLRSGYSHHELLDDIIFTLDTRRTMLDWKSYGLVRALPDLEELPKQIGKPIRLPRVTSAHLGVVFTGQGAQWPRMGYELLAWPVFRASLDRSQEYLQEMGCEWRIIGKSPHAIYLP